MLNDDLEWGAVDPAKGRPTRAGGHSVAIRFHELLVILFIIGCLMGLILPALQMTTHCPCTGRSGQCANNLKQIGIALLAYSERNNQLPPAAIRDKDGKPLLSWRVAILPQIDQKGIYDEFHLDEPWDSPHNKTLIPFIPWVYSCPSRRCERGETSYLAFVGPGTLFENPEGTPLSKITDGMSQTIAVIEGNRNVPWTKPDDLSYAPNQPLPALDNVHPMGLYSLFGDGSVHSFRPDELPEARLRALITRNGGETVEP